MANFNTSYLTKLFVKVPASVTGFDGATASQNSYKIFFDEATDTIWAKGNQYGISPDYKTKVDNLLTYVGADTDTAAADGSLYARIAAAVLATDQLRATTYSYTDRYDADQSTEGSIAYIAYDVATDVLNNYIGIGEDEDLIINRVSEIVTWFNGISESETGAALLSDVTALKSYVGTPDDEAAQNGTAYAQIKWLKTQLSEKNVAAEGDSLVVAYADANKVWAYASSELSQAVTYAYSAAQTITQSENNGLISVSADNRAYTVAPTQKLTDAVAKAESAAQSITTANDDLITVTPTGTAYEIAYTTALGTAVTNANSAVQTLSIAGHELNKTNNTLSAADLKADILGDIDGNFTYTDDASGIVVTITYADGVITNVTLSGAALDTRVDDIENYITNYDPWEVQGA